MPHDIIDNLEVKLSEVLKQKLAIAKKAQIAVGFLFLSGFKEIREEIDKLEKLEILAGSRTNRKTAEAIMLSEKWTKASQAVLEKQKYLNEEQKEKLLQKEQKEFFESLGYMQASKENVEFLAWFLEKLRTKKIEIRVYYKEPLHAKLYLFEYQDKRHGQGEAIVGSSNFSLGGFSQNTELNARLLGDENFSHLSAWFSQRWQESERTDFTVLAQKAIEKSWAFNQEATPFRVYLRILREIFDYQEKEPIIEDIAKLFSFQKDAVRDALFRLRKFNGVFISDVPGLGKTLIGSALLSHLETEGKRAIVVVPPKLQEYWQDWLSELGCSKAKVFSNGKLSEILENQKDLQREVVLIDECHHFRNKDTNRYRDMAKICEKKQVIMLSATPQNLNIWDLYWQIKLFTPYEVNHNFRIYPVELKKYFDLCDKKQANIDDLIGQLFIRRTRADIREYYPQENIHFPERKGPFRIDYSIDGVYEGGLYQQLRKWIGELNYARYDLSKYAKKEKFASADEWQRMEVAWGNLPGLIKINFNRRLESSTQAFRDSIINNLDRSRSFLRVLTEKNKVVLGDLDDLADLTDEELDDFEFNEKDFIDGEKFEVGKLKNDLQKDIAVLERMLNGVKNISPQDDDKLQKLAEILQGSELVGKKIIVFSSYASTIKYLYENLKNNFEKVDFICGGGDVSQKTKRFAPKANSAIIKPDEEIKILFSTEVLSEGVNLQDGQVVINYDLHWNPVRIIQRIGRIDRINSEHKEIYLYNFFPEIEAEKSIGIEQRVKQRIDDIIENFGYDQKTISLEEIEVRKKLFEVYTENSAVLEDDKEKTRGSNYFELQFKKLKNDFADEYKKALDLPAMAQIACQKNNEGLAVFCRADDYYGLKMADFNGNITENDIWRILKILECELQTKGEKFNQNYLEIIEKVKIVFEQEANQREQDKKNYHEPIKNEFNGFVNRMKIGESKAIKAEFNGLNDFVLAKQFNYGTEKETRALIRSYPKKFGLSKKEILAELKNFVNEKLTACPPAIKPPVKQKYAKIIISEEFV